jgi:hypothetical protein
MTIMDGGKMDCGHCPHTHQMKQFCMSKHVQIKCENWFNFAFGSSRASRLRCSLGESMISSD